jgi:hypothetical protein
MNSNEVKTVKQSLANTPRTTTTTTEIKDEGKAKEAEEINLAVE